VRARTTGGIGCGFLGHAAGRHQQGGASGRGRDRGRGQAAARPRHSRPHPRPPPCHPSPPPAPSHSGPEAAEYLQDHLLQYLQDAPPGALASSPGAALGAAVERAEREIVSKFAARGCNAGSTLLAALLLDSRLHVANGAGAGARRPLPSQRAARAGCRRASPLASRCPTPACSPAHWPQPALPPPHRPAVGDCRAVLARGSEAIQITTDHKPGDEAEAARIAREHGLAAGSDLSLPSPAGLGPSPGPSPGGPGRGGRSSGGGRSSAGGDEPERLGALSPTGSDAPYLYHGPSREASAAGSAAAAAAAALRGVGATSGGSSWGGPLVSADGYLYGELAVARAIGSQHLKRDPTKRAFTFTPDIFAVDLAREDDLLVLASDGLWDKVENSEAVTAARRTMAREKDAGACARALVDRALRRNSTDNISVVVVALHDRGISLPKTNSMLFRRLAGADGGSRPATPAGSAPATPVPAGSPAGGSRCETPL
jgi:serine/threonine protein phosphatase PrpC